MSSLNSASNHTGDFPQGSSNISQWTYETSTDAMQWVTPYYPYYYTKCSCSGEVEALRAWLEGYLEDRELTPEALEKIRERLLKF